MQISGSHITINLFNYFQYFAKDYIHRQIRFEMKEAIKISPILRAHIYMCTLQYIWNILAY